MDQYSDYIDTEDLMRPAGPAMARGLVGCCPSCGIGSLYSQYLKVWDQCPHCGEPLHHQRADDAPAYFTILIVGHLMVPMAVVVERLFSPPVLYSLLFWLPAIIGVSLWLLPRIKGALIGFQWAKLMHGFEEEARLRLEWPSRPDR